MTARLIHGECIEQMKLLSDNSVDLFVCDLPYGQLTTPKIGGQANTKCSTERCDWDIKIDLAAFWEQVERLSKSDHTPVLHFCNTKFGIELINSKPDWFRYDLVWNKERGVSFLLANKQPMRSHEMIYVFSKKGTFYNRIDIKGEYKHYKNPRRPDGCAGSIVYNRSGEYIKHSRDTPADERCALSIINIKKNATAGQHPTEKPVDLYKWLIERYSNKGDTVMDPTAGSFNSILAAVQLDRNGIGVEKSDEFYNRAVAKFQPRNEIVPPTSQSPEE
jgi:DNA modification methylase